MISASCIKPINSIPHSKYTPLIAVRSGKPVLEPLSKTSRNLFHCLRVLINDTWKEIKAGNMLNDKPRFIVSDKKEVVTIEPIYGQKRPIISIEVGNKRYTDKFYIDSILPENYKYERTILTDYGEATVKTHDTRNGDNVQLNCFMNNIIEKYFPRIIPKDIKKLIFGRYYFLDMNKAENKLI